MITFLFDRRSFTLWTLALTTAAVLLFLGGLVVGLRLNLPPEVAGSSAAAEIEQLARSATKGVTAPAPPERPAPPPSAPAPGTPSPPPSPGQVGVNAAQPLPSGGSQSTERPELGDPVPFAPPGWEPPAEAAEQLGGVRTAALEADPEPSPRTAAAARSQPMALVKRAERPVPVPPSRTAPEERYSVQLGAYRDKGNAERMQQALQVEGLDTYLIVDHTAGGDVLYTVRAGRYTTRDEAQVAAADLTARGRDAWVPVPVGRR